MTAVLYIIGDLLQQSIVGDIKRRNDEDLVAREVRVLREDEVSADVETIERVMDLIDQRSRNPRQAVRSTTANRSW